MDIALALASFACLQASEEGFTPIFNGKDLAGIKVFLPGADNDKTKTFSVADGAIVCSGNPAGYWYTEKRYGDCILRFDYRYKRPADLQDDAKFSGNSGILFFVKEHKVWPHSLETQGRDRTVGDIFFIDAKDNAKNKATVDKEARAKALKPVGEWSTYEVVVKGGKIEVSINGTKITTVQSHEYSGPGHIGFQSEGAEIHWRNLRIKELK
jgi:hypothetical protein